MVRHGTIGGVLEVGLVLTGAVLASVPRAVHEQGVTMRFSSREPAAEQERAQLLPGEEPESQSLEDAAHWVDVYRGLIDTVEPIATGPAWERPATDGDCGPAQMDLRKRLEHLHEQLQFWQRRMHEIEAPPM